MSFYVAEETLDGLWYGKTFADSIPKLGGGFFMGALDQFGPRDADYAA